MAHKSKGATGGHRNISVGGNVTGSTLVTGDGNVTITEASRDDLLRLLAEMQALVRQSGLDERQTRVVEADVQAAEDEAKAPEPSRTIIASRLEGMTRILNAASGLTEAGRKLLAHAEKALSWVGMLA